MTSYCTNTQINKSVSLLGAQPEKALAIMPQDLSSIDAESLYLWAFRARFHEQLKLKAEECLLVAAQTGYLPAVVIIVSYLYRNGYEKHGYNYLKMFSNNIFINNLLKMLKPQASISHDLELFSLSDPILPEMELINKELGLKSIKNFICEFDSVWLALRANNELEPSYIIDRTTGQKRLDKVRTSLGCQIKPSENDWLILDLQYRIAKAIGARLPQLEINSFLLYAPGQEYKSHYDYFDPRYEGSDSHLQNGGQRTRTALVYLNDTYSGGETEFPKVSLSYKGSAKELIVFDNLTKSGELNPLTLHRSVPIKNGHKWIVNQWVREGETLYYSKAKEFELLP
ncbi:hypothetical protein CWB72_14090 [Pseudoalteromonas phenolica]|uniref:prolyl hydroxylase family protein n=1 Tax=Pseudoalteromonas phenolica TaxID=161398 RepID=UPI00110AB7BF|nr:2OG-Fe(II) oxygenase [Pseudoalteromonas phenolica]TMN87912.1 hypothetical protein CWB72_14090 [Pseudoalteromonas phenolica]